MSLSEPLPASQTPAGFTRARRSVLLGVKVVLIRLRFLLVLLGILLLVGSWDVVRNYWDKLTRSSKLADAPVSLDTEYWCPMCPGVVSEWPGKCPVCNMALVRRKKGEAVPLPDGVVARMQLSPYRIQLAGIRTSPVEYRPLAREVVVVGPVESAGETSKDPGNTGHLCLRGEVFERDVSFVALGQEAEVSTDAFPAQTFVGKVVWLAPGLTPETHRLAIRVEIEDPQKELRPGTLATARLRMPLAQTANVHRLVLEDWRNRTTVDLLIHALLQPAGLGSGGGLESLMRSACQRVFLSKGLVLTVPESAVVDTGEKRVVFVETMPGTFDGTEVVLGRRCGDFYPVLRGLEPGQQVVTAGAFLLDAETRLNPSAAAAYFGAARGPALPATGGGAASEEKGLSREDQALAARQKLCPVTGEPLDSMGGPVKVVVAGRTVFVCCKGCEPALRKEPEKYLSKLGK
jgi:Cu(I)/Ag(I) efflux system membrane fusion protein